MNRIDLILACVLALFGLRGFFRGFFREIFSVVGLIAGFMLAAAFAQPGAAYAGAWWNLPPLILKGGAFIAIFFFIYFSFNLVGWLLHRSESLLFLKSLNRVGGIVVGLGKGAAILALILFFLAATSSREDHRFDGSYLVSPLSRFAEGLIRIGKQKVLNRIDAVQSASTGAPRL